MSFDPSDYVKESKKAARIVAESYMKFEPQDIAQAILLDMYEEPKRYSKIKGSLLFKVMLRAGYRYCQNQASRLLATEDQYTYSAEEVKQLLHRYYDPANWPNGWQQPSFAAHEGSIEEFAHELELWADHTRICVDLFDIETAIGKLRASHKKVIEKKYRDQEDLTSSEQKAISAAVRLMTYYVNETSSKKRNPPWDYEGPGARKALSNSQSQNLIYAEY